MKTSRSSGSEDQVEHQHVDREDAVGDLAEPERHRAAQLLARPALALRARRRGAARRTRPRRRTARPWRRPPSRRASSSSRGPASGEQASAKTRDGEDPAAGEVVAEPVEEVVAGVGRRGSAETAAKHEADHEPRQVAGQPLRVVRLVAGDLRHRRPARRRRRPRARPAPTSTRRSRSAGAAAADEGQADQRQHEVERDLGAQAPHLGQRARPAGRGGRAG